MTSLSLDASPEEIAAAIEAVQRRARLRRCQEPLRLALEVTTQIARAKVMAAARGLELAELLPSGCWWEGSAHEAETLVRLSSTRFGRLDQPAEARLEVLRASPGCGDSQGRLSLHLRRAG